MALKDNTPCGTIRFDIDGEQAEIGIYIDPSFWGKGLGTQLLKLGESEIKKRVPNLKKIIAKIRVDNWASLKLFRKANYKENFVQMDKELD